MNRYIHFHVELATLDFLDVIVKGFFFCISVLVTLIT